jgi:hypothetical protein
VRSQFLLVLLLAAFAADAAAQVAVPSGTTVVETGPGWGIASVTTMAQGRVVAVDAPSRRLDLELADGRLVGLRAGAEVRRLHEIRVGDVINVAFVEALVLELRKNGAPVVTRSQGTDVRRGPSNAPAAGVRTAEETVLADVLAVDRALGTVTLRGPSQVVSLRIRDPRQLALIEVGDQVQATYAEATAVSVDPVP